MWIYTKNGFYSVVQDKNDPDYLIVRARVKGDLEALCEGLGFNTTIKETPDNDYRYRIKMPRVMVSHLVSLSVSEINYPNFKDSISDKRRSPYYGSVWSAMALMQDVLIKDTNKK